MIGKQCCITQSINRPTNQSIHQSINQPINQSNFSVSRTQQGGQTDNVKRVILLCLTTTRLHKCAYSDGDDHMHDHMDVCVRDALQRVLHMQCNFRTAWAKSHCLQRSMQCKFLPQSSHAEHLRQVSLTAQMLSSLPQPHQQKFLLLLHKVMRAQAHGSLSHVRLPCSGARHEPIAHSCCWLPQLQRVAGAQRYAGNCNLPACVCGPNMMRCQFS